MTREDVIEAVAVGISLALVLHALGVIHGA